MTNEELLEAFKYWQECGYIHPFTCGGKNCPHISLVPEIQQDIVILKCPECGAEQETLSFAKTVYAYYLDRENNDILKWLKR
jgi:hypothetical protein